MGYFDAQSVGGVSIVRGARGLICKDVIRDNDGREVWGCRIPGLKRETGGTRPVKVRSCHEERENLGWGFVLSHPCDRKKSQGWGTGHLANRELSIPGLASETWDTQLSIRKMPRAPSLRFLSVARVGKHKSPSQVLAFFMARPHLNWPGAPGLAFETGDTTTPNLPAVVISNHILAD